MEEGKRRGGIWSRGFKARVCERMSACADCIATPDAVEVVAFPHAPGVEPPERPPPAEGFDGAHPPARLFLDFEDLLSPDEPGALSDLGQLLFPVEDRTLMVVPSR